MTVMINDFEVVAEPPKSDTKTGSGDERTARTIPGEDLERGLRLQKERAERVRAY